MTKALVRETGAKTEAPGFEAKTEAVASKTEAVDPKTEAKAARQLIGIGYVIPININIGNFIAKRHKYNVPKCSRYLTVSTNMTQFM